MIHELIDPKKRIAVRSNGTKNGKIPSDVIAKSNDATHPRLESYSENESREHGSTSNTFIPPWLRSSLGFNQRNSQNLDWSVCLPNFNALGHALSDQKSSKSVPRYKDHVNCGPEETKVDDQSECTIRVTCDLSNTINQDCLEDVNMSANADVTSVNCHHERSNTVYWSNARKGSEGESLCTNPEIKILQRDPKLSHGNAKEDDKRQSKMSKQRTRGRRRIYNEYNFDGEKKEVDLMVEVKAKEILDNYSKQEAHSTSSDMKQLEAKLILLGAKCRQVDSAKWNQHEMKLLQEIKEQTGNKEEFDKFMTHVIETNLSDRLKISERSLKLKRERSKKEDKKIGCMEKEKLDKEVVAESRLTVSDRDSVKSTDEENDIKRFSEFLSKNKNIDEKRKCLEEVRNYFERKRRTRLTKRRCSDEDKKGKNDEIVRQLATEKDDHPRERPSTGKNWTSLSGGKEKKSKFVPCNEGVVEKAVSETLQKFMSYYHFHVSPTMMGNMRRNILEAIQSDSLDSTPSKMNLTKGNSVSLENTKDGRIPYRAKESCDEAREIKCVTNDGLKCSSGSYETTDESNKACCTPTATSNHFQPEGRTGKDVPPVENDNFEILKNEFDNCLKSVQCHADGSGLKLQSLIMEREETSTVKGIRFLYNFTKKSLEFAQLDSDEKKSCTGDMVKSKNFKESETQTSFQSEVMMKSTRIQTIDMTNKEENSVQTDDKTYVDNSVQTDSNQSSNIKEVRELKDVNVIPGLYRMVKSRHIGRFYLYPEESKTHILPKTTATTLTSNMTDSSFAFKCNHCNVKTKTDMLNMHNHEENTKSSKELKVLYRDKSSGVGGRRSRVQCYRTQRLPPESNLESSISCLYFGNSGNSGKSCDEGNPLDKCDISSGEAEHEEEHNMRATDDHFGCFWFWNGEKITPGSDLKIHVEDLLKEKLKEINTQHKEILMKFIEVGRKGEKNRISQEDDTTNKQPPIKKSSNQMLEVKNANAVYCFKNDNPGEASSLLKRIRLARGIQCRGEVLKFDKSMGDVGTRSGYLSSNISKLKSKSKMGGLSKMSRTVRKKGQVIKSVREKKKHVSKVKTKGNLIKVVREIRDLEKERVTSPESSSVSEVSTTSSLEKNTFANAISSILEGKRRTEVGETDNLGKNKINQNSKSEQFEAKVRCTTDRKKPGDESSGKNEEAGKERNNRLVERILNKVSHKERERDLWNDVRQFIKQKVGRDIDVEGAREICIEIEQEMPKVGQGKLKETVLAKGHYIRNEGDVEVEIDLTLNDLERILRQRHKKLRKKQMWNSVRSKKLFSSSSTLSCLARRETHMTVHKEPLKIPFAKAFEAK